MVQLVFVSVVWDMRDNLDAEEKSCGFLPNYLFPVDL
jgi:hypothetical protein